MLGLFNKQEKAQETRAREEREHNKIAVWVTYSDTRENVICVEEKRKQINVIMISLINELRLWRSTDTLKLIDTQTLIGLLD